MISIIIPNFNKVLFIAETLDSLLAQTFTNWEAIIIDDKSTDNSLAIINNYLDKDMRFKLIQNEVNSGGSYSRNRALDIAKGEYIIFLDSDDFLTPTCLEKRHASILNTENNLVVFPMGTFYKYIGDSSSAWIPKPSDNHLRKFLSHDLPWSIMQTIWKKDFLLSLNGFDEEYPRLQDVELHTRALLNSEISYKVHPSKVPDCYYRIDEKRISTSPNKFLANLINGSCLYLDKTSKNLGNHPQKKVLLSKLRGTYFTVLNQLLYNYLQHTISYETFTALSQQLNHTANQHLELTKAHHYLITLYQEGFNRYKFKGYNWIFKKIFLL